MISCRRKIIFHLLSQPCVSMQERACYNLTPAFVLPKSKDTFKHRGVQCALNDIVSAHSANQVKQVL